VLALLATAIAGAQEESVFTKNDKAFYLEKHLQLFIRPGLEIEIVGASIDEDGTIRARFTLADPQGLPLDRGGVFTPGAVSTSFIAAVIPAGQRQYTSYTARTSNSSITNMSAEQASSDSGGSYETVGDGEYIYTFGTKAPAGFDRTATHTIGIYARRDLNDFDLGQPSNDATYNFVPDGSEVTVVRDVVATDTCNDCHTRLTLHGRRHSVELCVLCHQPQSADPDTGNTVDFPVMIHKIHMGADLPSVQAGTPYQIIGFRNSVHDYSTVEFPADARNCNACHTQDTDENKAALAEAAAGLAAVAGMPGRSRAASARADLAKQVQGGNYLTKPSRAACGACHDDVNFATGEHHAGLRQISDNQCANCHFPEGELEFDLSIVGAHKVDRFSNQLPGTNFEILSVTNSAPGQNPTVIFNITNDAGQTVPPSMMGRLALVVAGNTGDFSEFVSENPSGATPATGGFAYTFQAPIPADAAGTWAVGIEGYQNAPIVTREGEESVRDAGDNKVFYFPVTDTEAVPRRQVVAQDKCDTCHTDLNIHGSNRNAVEHCVLCHNPNTTDMNRRPGDQGLPESVNFKVMIHKIHTGEQLGEEYVVYGFGNTPHNFGEILFPGDRRKCQICHVDGTEQLPLREGLLATEAPRELINPLPPATGACLSCHRDLSAAAHADLNTSPNLGEACGVCHKDGADFSVDRVHAQ
jgi:hypothetical protein